MDEDIDNIDEVQDDDEDYDDDDEDDALADLDAAEEAEEEEEEENEDDDDDEERETIVRETPVSVQRRLNVHIVPRDERKTSDMMSLFELSSVIGVRAQQIENGDISFAGEGLTKAIDIAEREVIERMCPLMIERTVFSTKEDIFVEHWKVNELAIPQSELGISQSGKGI